MTRPLPPLDSVRKLVEHLVPNADPGNDADMLAVGNMVIATNARDAQIVKALEEAEGLYAQNPEVRHALRDFAARLKGARGEAPAATFIPTLGPVLALVVEAHAAVSNLSTAMVNDLGTLDARDGYARAMTDFLAKIGDLVTGSQERSAPPAPAILKEDLDVVTAVALNFHFYDRAHKDRVHHAIARLRVLVAGGT